MMVEAALELFPLIKLAKKLKGEKKWLPTTQPCKFPLIKLAKKLKEGKPKPFLQPSRFPLIKLAKKLKD